MHHNVCLHLVILCRLYPVLEHIIKCVQAEGCRALLHADENQFFAI